MTEPTESQSVAALEDISVRAVEQLVDTRTKLAEVEAERDQLAAEVKRLGATVLRVEGLRDQWLGITLADIHGQGARLLGELTVALRPAAPTEQQAGLTIAAPGPAGLSPEDTGALLRAYNASSPTATTHVPSEDSQF